MINGIWTHNTLYNPIAFTSSWIGILVGVKDPIFLRWYGIGMNQQQAWEGEVFVGHPMVGVMNKFNKELVEY